MASGVVIVVLQSGKRVVRQIYLAGAFAGHKNYYLSLGQPHLEPSRFFGLLIWHEFALVVVDKDEVSESVCALEVDYEVGADLALVNDSAGLVVAGCNDVADAGIEGCQQVRTSGKGLDRDGSIRSDRVRSTNTDEDVL